MVERYRSRSYACCLTDNHYHLLIETPEANLSRGMREPNGVYTRSFNRGHKRSGHLFEGRYKSILVELARYLVQPRCRRGWSGILEVGVGRVIRPRLDWRSRKQAQGAYRGFVAQGGKGGGLAGAEGWRGFGRGGLRKEGCEEAELGGTVCRGEGHYSTVSRIVGKQRRLTSNVKT